MVSQELRVVDVMAGQLTGEKRYRTEDGSIWESSLFPPTTTTTTTGSGGCQGELVAGEDGVLRIRTKL
jgi:hypothetical protein